MDLLPHLTFYPPFILSDHLSNYNSKHRKRYYQSKLKVASVSLLLCEKGAELPSFPKESKLMELRRMLFPETLSSSIYFIVTYSSSDAGLSIGTHRFSDYNISSCSGIDSIGYFVCIMGILLSREKVIEIRYR